MALNWGLAGGNAFGNALATGMAMGGELRQRREETDKRNAFAAYATNPTREGIAGIAQHSPEFAMREGARFDQQAAQQQQKQQADMGTFRQLLAKAAESPEGWQQAMGAAQSLGLDTSSVPQQFDPAWAKQQLFIVEAMEKDQDKLPGIAEELRAAGYEPGTPEFVEAIRGVIQNKYATEYVDENGNTRRRSALSLAPPTAQQTKQIGGKTYYQEGGEWFEQEGGADAPRVGSNFLDGL